MSNNPQFLIRMPDGSLFSRMHGFQVEVTSLESQAFPFRSRMAALQIMGLTADFAGAEIVEASPQPLEAA